MAIPGLAMTAMATPNLTFNITFLPINYLIQLPQLDLTLKRESISLVSTLHGNVFVAILFT